MCVIVCIWLTIVIIYAFEQRQVDGRQIWYIWHQSILVMKLKYVANWSDSISFFFFAIWLVFEKLIIMKIFEQWLLTIMWQNKNS